ncbi:MAG: HAD hydrolase-like protein [Gemmatimonadetes bacterium]|nr:HAD hydrolase-like protein [Gemmatimonadota bacterium]
MHPAALLLDLDGTLFVGDEAETDIAGAQATGLLDVRVRTAKYRPDARGDAGRARPRDACSRPRREFS